MKILVIGLGSMGRRRIRLIKKHNTLHCILGVDLSSSRREQAEIEFGIQTIDSLEEALKEHKFDCAIVCTSPLSHSSIIGICLKSDLHVFTELNLVSDGYDENIQEASKRKKVLFLSSTFLHRSEIQEIGKKVKTQSTRVNYIYHIGQYLPDWHPWENYKDYFVGNSRTNGCREIFAIELPWLIEVFGSVKDITVKKDKLTSLNIDYCDNYMIIIEHETGHKGMLTVDVVSRKAVRNLEIYGEELYLSWDGSAEGLIIMDINSKVEEKIRLYDTVDQLSEYSNFVVENAYFDEISQFFDVIELKAKPIYSFDKDKIVLELIDRIEA
jgi:predicted dehydrogenase